MGVRIRGRSGIDPLLQTQPGQSAMSKTSKKKSHRTTMNYRLISACFVVLILLAVGVYGLHHLQLRRHLSTLVRDGSARERDGKYAEAADAWRRYLTVKPDNIEVQARYGLALDKAAKTPAERLEAMVVLDEVLRQDPERTAVRSAALRLAMSLGRWPEARAHIDVLAGANPDAPTFEDLRGQCLAEEGRLEDAVKSYRAALTHDPKARATASRLADLFADKLNQAEHGGEVMDDLVSADPSDYQVYLKRAEFRQRHKLKGIEKDITKARELSPDDPDVILASAILADRTKGPADARVELERGIKTHPKDIRFYTVLGEMELRLHRLAEAKDAVSRGLKVVPDQDELRWILANALIQSGQSTEATEVIAALRKSRTNPRALAALDFLEAKNLTPSRRWLEVARRMEGVLPKLEPWPEIQREASLILGRCYLELGDVEKRQDAYRRATTGLSPDSGFWVDTHLELAAAMADQGRIADALRESRLVLPKRPAVSVFIARTLVRQQMALPPSQRNWAEAEKSIAEADRLMPNLPEVGLLRAEMLQVRGDLKGTRAALEAVQSRWPDRIEPLLGLAILDGREGKLDKAEAGIDQAAKKVGDRVDIRLARARVLVDQGRDAAMKGLPALAADRSSFTEDQERGLLSGLVDAYLRVNAPVEAQKLWSRVVELQPNNLGVLVRAFDLATWAGDQEGMAKTLDDIHKIEGEDGKYWHLGRAFLIIRQKIAGKAISLEEARDHLAKVMSRRGDWPRAVLAEAQLDDLEGNHAQAAQHFFRAVELGESNPRVLQRALILLVEQQRFAEADQVVHKLAELGPIPDELKRVASEVALKNKDTDRALQLARAATTGPTKSAGAYVWLGQLLTNQSRQADSKGEREQATKMREEAEKALRAAIQLPSAGPATRVVLLQFLLSNDQKAEAEAVMKELEALPAERRDPLALAQAYEFLGRAEDARKLYQEALAAKPEDPGVLRAVAAAGLRGNRIKEAEPLLTKLLTLKGAPASEVAWARQALGISLAVSRDYHERARALDLLGIGAETETGAATAGSIEDRRTNARVLAYQPNLAQRQRAIKILEGLISEKTASDDDQFVLAQLYESGGEWTKTRDVMLSLLASDRKNPNYLVFFANCLLLRGQVDEASTVLSSLGALEPSSFRTTELKARVLHLRDKDQDAVALVQKYLAQPGNEIATAAAANLLERIGQAEAAEKLYRTLAARPNTPANMLALAQFLGRQGRIKDAIDLCEVVRATNPSENATEAAARILFVAKLDPDQADRVERWLKEEAARSPEKTSIKFAMANLHILCGRYDEAEAVYRALSERGDRASGSLALNNLAWLLALHTQRASEALAFINRAIASEGPRPELLDTRAVVYLASGQPQSAIADLNEAIVNAPRPEFYFHLAQAYFQLNDRKNAFDNMEKAKTAGLRVETLDPVERTAYKQLAADLGRG
jgi:cellulose synthase operon protein C